MLATEDMEGMPGRAAGRGDRAERVFVREYEAGRLVREDPISPEELEAVFGPFRRRADRAERRQRRRRRVSAVKLFMPYFTFRQHHIEWC